MKLDLALAANLKKPVTMRPIIPTMAQENELYSIYADSIRIWQECVNEISRAWVKPELTIDADGQQLTWLMDQYQRQLDDTLIYQTEKLGRWVTKVGQWNGRRTISGAKSATGVDIAPFIRLSDVRDQLELSIRQNVALISNVNADMRNRIEQIIFEGFAQRRTKKQITDSLARAMGITKRRARIIAGDQLHKLNITLSQVRNLQLGIEFYKWRHTPQRNPRHTHVLRDGKTFRWDKPPDDGLPGYAINCKCYSESVLEPHDG